ncbi:MAG: alpha/beta hydrolase [Propionibacteriaceae bacterium]|jgi:acetyl esterase|nr:alpha/beta hydrolase [Propionibacteriaceae bacterium]
MTWSVEPEVDAWIARGAEISTEIGIDQSLSLESQRAAAGELSARLFSEYGEPGDQAVIKTFHQVPGPSGPVTVVQYRLPPAGPPMGGPTPVGSLADGPPVADSPSGGSLPPDSSSAGSAPTTSPLSGPPPGGLLPALLLLHGGGWAIGSVAEDIDDSLARFRASRGGCAVFDIEYRLAPEHVFPAGLEDAYAALCWLSGSALELGIDADRIILNGSSAGANLCAGLALLARDRGGPAVFAQVLEVPAVDLSDDGVWEQECADLANGIGTTKGIRTAYLAGHPASDPYVSPLLAADLSGLPPAHIITAEIDPLRDQGLAYARKLRQAGVPVSATCHLGALHGSAGIIGRLRDARLWQAEVVAAIRDFLR